MLPLSFKEYIETRSRQNPEKESLNYLQCGGFPYTVIGLKDDRNMLNSYLDGIYNTIVVKDIEERSMRKSNGSDLHGINNILLLRTISSFLASSTGSLISLRNIAKCLYSIDRASVATISGYTKALEEAYLFYPAHAMNVIGKQLLKNVVKYYIVYPGLRSYLVPRQNCDLGFLLENIVYLELRRRGYEVYIGKMRDWEVDFIAQKSGTYEYFQITANCSAEEIFKREIGPLQKIKDDYKKTILTLDNFTLGNYGGIFVKNAIDWLLAKDAK